jgi:hypothetical protein
MYRIDDNDRFLERCIVWSLSSYLMRCVFICEELSAD